MQKKHGKILIALTVLLLLTLACNLTTCVNADLTWTIETVDSTENAGFFSSIALDSAGNPHISYHDIIKGDLKYAKWTGASWAIETVDSTERIGLQTSLVLDSSNNPHMSYYVATGHNLGYAYWTGNSWNTQTVDTIGDVANYNSLALDSYLRKSIVKSTFLLMLVKKKSKSLFFVTSYLNELLNPFPVWIAVIKK